MLRLQHLYKAFLGKQILKDVSYLFPNNKRVALVGANGAGKTTLLNIICKLEELDSGEIIIPKDCRIGYLPQEPNSNPAATIIEECMAGMGDLSKIKEQLDQALLEMGQDYTDEKYAHYEKLEHQFSSGGGYALEANAKKILVGLGFTTNQFDLGPLTLSGGWRMRLELAKLLLKEPNFLILDEPTNHLDLPSIIWLEGYFKRFQGTLLFVSHDQDLLNRLSQITLHLNQGTLTPYTGNFDSFLEQYEANQAMSEQQLKTLQKRSAQIEKFVERFGAKASKAKQVKSKMKMLDRLRVVENSIGVDQDPAEISIDIKMTQKSGNNVLTLENCSIGYDKPLFKNLNLKIHRGQKIAIIGSNGIGKSTLLKSIVSLVPFLSGKCELGHNVITGYYAQDQLAYLVQEASALENVMNFGQGLTQQRARTLLGQMMMKDQDAFKPVRVLSGGEKSRVGLACLLAQGANFLLLDEPTNHLDMSSSEVLAGALADYEGTVLFISHNRSFINEVATHIFAMTQDGKSMMFEGNIEDYIRLAERANFPNILAGDA